MIDFILSFTYVLLIITSVFFGISIAVNLWLSSTVKNVQKEVDKNYKKIDNEEQRIVLDRAIYRAKQDFNEYLASAKKIKKIENRNKIRKVFKLKQKSVPKNEYDVKLIFNELLKGIYFPFDNGDKNFRGYLSFTEREIFNILKALNKRLEEIFSSSKIIWLSSIKISFIAECIFYYKKFENIKNKVWVVILLNVINFFMWFGKLLSPTALSKYYIKSISGDSLSSLLYTTAVEIVGKELAVIYKEQRFKEN